MRDELRHTLILAFGTGISSLLRIAFVVYSARVLGPAAYADLYAALSLIFLFAAGMAPISGTVSRFTSLHLAAGDAGALAGLRRFARVQVWRIAALLLVLSPAVVVVLWRQLAVESPILPILTAALLPVVLLLDLPRGVLRGALAFTRFSLNISVEALLRLALCVALLAWAPTAEASLFAYLLAALVALPIAERQAAAIGAGAEPEPADARMLRRFGAGFFVIAFVGAALQNLDVLIARQLFPAVDAGLYSAASSLAKVVGLIFLPFGLQLLPVLTARFAEGRRPVGTLATLMGAFAALSLGTIAVLSWLGERVLGILYGADYLAAQPLIAPLGAALTFAFLSILLGQAFTAMSRFGFIPFYVAGLGVEIGLLYLARGSMERFAEALLLAQLVTFAIVLVCFLVTVRTGKREAA